MAAGVIIAGLAGLEAAVGQELGVSAWQPVRQEDIDLFAAMSGDDYWLHTDPQRASSTPLGTTIAHGLLTLSLGSMFTQRIVDFRGFGLTMNLGYDRVRFPAPLPVDSRVRMRLTLRAVQRLADGARGSLTQTFEREGGDRPVCVAELVLRFLDEPPAGRDPVM